MSDARVQADTLLTDKEAAAYLGVARQTVWAHVKRGIIPQPVKLGGITRFLLSDILGAIEAAKQQRAA